MQLFDLTLEADVVVRAEVVVALTVVVAVLLAVDTKGFGLAPGIVLESAAGCVAGFRVIVRGAAMG